MEKMAFEFDDAAEADFYEIGDITNNLRSESRCRLFAGQLCFSISTLLFKNFSVSFSKLSA